MKSSQAVLWCVVIVAACVLLSFLFPQRREMFASGVTWTAPSLVNNWQFFGAPFSVPGYFKDDDGFVTLRGLIKGGQAGNGGAAVMFTLPAGMTPPNQLIFTVSASDGYGQVRIYPDGTVQLTTGNPGWVSLENIAFSTSP